MNENVLSIQSVFQYSPGYEKSEKQLVKMIKLELMLLLGILSILIIASAVTTHADNLLDIVNYDGFKGSLEVFSNYAIFNKLGWLLNFIISAFSFIGFFLLFYQRMVTILYLSAKPLFNKIHDMKGTGSKPLGLDAIFNNVMGKGQIKSTGMDAIIDFFLSLLPDVKEASDYNDRAKEIYNLTDNDTITTYLLHISLQTILLMFAFAMGFNGTLFAAYATITEAMCTVADNFVELKLDAYVDRLINSGQAYKFAYDADGSNIGKIQQDIAEKVYAKCVKQLAEPSTDANLKVGAAVDEKLKDKFGKTTINRGNANEDSSNPNKSTEDGMYGSGAVASKEFKEWVNKGANNPDWDGFDSTSSVINYNVVLNSTADDYNDGDYVIGLTELNIAPYSFVSNGGTPLYIHVIMSRDTSKPDKNYMKNSNNDNKTTTGGSNGQVEKKSGNKQ
jgi:hypothetical protein